MALGKKADYKWAWILAFVLALLAVIIFLVGSVGSGRSNPFAALGLL